MLEEEQIKEAAMQKKKLLTGLFLDRESAENAYSGLRDKGYTNSEINLVMSDETREKYFKNNLIETDMATKATEGASIGGAVGGTIGAIVGVLAALGTSVVVPVLGIMVAGPIAAGIAGIGSGVVTGGIIGALVGVGIPEEQATVYESGVKKGKIVLGVHPRNDEDAEYFEKLWKANRAEVFYS
jgi:hypothetical protein